MEQVEQRHSEDRRTDSSQMHNLRFELDNSQKKIRSLEQKIEGLREAEEQKLGRLEKEKEGLEIDLEHLRKQQQELMLAETSLRSANQSESELCDSLRKQVLDMQTQLNEALADKQKCTGREKQLQLELDETRRAADKIRRDANDAIQKSDQVKQQLEKEIRSLKDAQNRPGLRDRPLTSFLQIPVSSMPLSSAASLVAEPIHHVHGHDELLPGMNHPFMEKVREAHTGVGIAMANADQVHLTSCQVQFASAANSLKRGMSASNGFYDFETKSQIELERQAGSSRVESRMHDLIALKEEAAVHHDLDESMLKQQILDYIDNDIADAKKNFCC